MWTALYFSDTVVICAEEGAEEADGAAAALEVLTALALEAEEPSFLQSLAI